MSCNNGRRMNHLGGGGVFGGREGGEEVYVNTTVVAYANACVYTHMQTQSIS